MGMADGQPGDDETGWSQERVYGGMGWKRRCEGGSSSVQSFQSLEESERTGCLGEPERVADGTVDAKKSGRTAERTGSRAAEVDGGNDGRMKAQDTVE